MKASTCEPTTAFAEPLTGTSIVKLQKQQPFEVIPPLSKALVDPTLSRSS